MQAFFIRDISCNPDICRRWCSKCQRFQIIGHFPEYARSCQARLLKSTAQRDAQVAAEVEAQREQDRLYRSQPSADCRLAAIKANGIENEEGGIDASCSSDAGCGDAVCSDVGCSNAPCSEADCPGTDRDRTHHFDAGDASHSAGGRVAAKHSDEGKKKAKTVFPFPWESSWGNQTCIVQGKTAREQVKDHLGLQQSALFVEMLTGEADGSDAAIDHALQVLLHVLKTGEIPKGAPAALPALLHTSTCCSKCGLQIAVNGYIGMSKCMLCAAQGDGLSLMDLQHAIVSNGLRGKGALPTCTAYVL